MYLLQFNSIAIHKISDVHFEFFYRVTNVTLIYLVLSFKFLLTFMYMPANFVVFFLKTKLNHLEGVKL